MESAFRTLTWASAVCTVASRPSLSHLRRPCCAALAAALAVAEFLWLRRHQFASGRLRLRDEGAQGGYEGLGRRVGLMSPLCAPPPFLFSRPTCRRRLFRGPCTSGAVAEESLGSLKPLRMCRQTLYISGSWDKFATYKARSGDSEYRAAKGLAGHGQQPRPLFGLHTSKCPRHEATCQPQMLRWKLNMSRT